MTRKISVLAAVAGIALMVASTSVAGQPPNPAAPAAAAPAAPAKLAPPVRGQVNISVTNPPVVPNAPTSLTATAQKKLRIQLAWKDNANNETGFKVERSVGGVTWTEIATLGANVTSYSSTGLTAGTTYSYRVRAYNAAGNSAYSNTASAKAVR